ncbi:MAG: HNH endonuclease [Bacteroidota bacterium]
MTPLSKEGTNELDNLAYSCQGCNNHKFTSTHASDSFSKEEVLIFNPRIDEWADHFSIVTGKTPTGRATIVKLQLNRKGVVNLRRVLRQFGVHPPK